jgi:hypothetical protein
LSGSAQVMSIVLDTALSSSQVMTTNWRGV